MNKVFWRRKFDIRDLEKRKPVLHKPPSLLQLSNQLEDDNFTCLFCPAGIDNNRARCSTKFDVQSPVDRLHRARLELISIIDNGLFKSASFISALMTIAQAFSCHDHRINEVML